MAAPVPERATDSDTATDFDTATDSGTATVSDTVADPAYALIDPRSRQRVLLASSFEPASRFKYLMHLQSMLPDSRRASVATSCHTISERFSDWFDSALSTLWMAYQPIFSRERELYGYEALVRTDEHRLGRPQLLFGAAARLGRIEELEARIRACVARDMSHAPPWLTFFVNIDPLITLSDPEVLVAADPLSWFPGQVVFEINVQAPVALVPRVDTKLKVCRALGYRFAIDDLGARHGSPSTLPLVEPEVVKLDMSLIRGLDESPTKRKRVADIMEACRRLEILTICKGIETKAEHDTLVDLGCHLLQGYYLGQPGRPLLLELRQSSVLRSSGASYVGTDCAA